MAKKSKKTEDDDTLQLVSDHAESNEDNDSAEEGKKNYRVSARAGKQVGASERERKESGEPSERSGRNEKRFMSGGAKDFSSLPSRRASRQDEDEDSDYEDAERRLLRSTRNRGYGERYGAPEGYAEAGRRISQGAYRGGYGESGYETNYGSRSANYNSDYNRARSNRSYAGGSEFDVGNEDYDYDMRYGRSGLERARDYDDRDYTTGYRSSGNYDEDDYDSNYGSSRDYAGQSFGNRSRNRVGYGSDQSSYGNRSGNRSYGGSQSAYGSGGGYESRNDYAQDGRYGNRSGNRSYGGSQSAYGSSGGYESSSRDRSYDSDNEDFDNYSSDRSSGDNYGPSRRRRSSGNY